MDAASWAALVVATAAFVIGVCLGYLPTAHWKRLYESKKIEADQWRQTANGYLTVDQHKRAKATKALDEVEIGLNAARTILQLPTRSDEAAVHRSQMQAYSDAWAAGRIPR